MGLISKGNSKNYTTNETTTQNAAFSEIHAPAASVQGSGNTLSFLDGGAIGQAFDFAGLAQNNANSFAENVSRAAANATTEAVRVVSESAKTETENLANSVMRWGFYAILAWGSFYTARSIWGKK